jgi:hypothetical protein
VSLYVAAYLAAIVAANLSVATFGPSVTIVNAFLLIGLDLTLRDRLHDAWEGRELVLRMGVLIAVGGLLSWLVNGAAGPIALASTVAFSLAAIADALIYAVLGERSRPVRVNGSNVVSSAVDSLVFPTLAFGGFLPFIVLGQFAAKVAGGFVWSVILAVPQRRRAA